MVYPRKVAVFWTTLFLVNLSFVAFTLYSSALEPPGIFPESGELVAPTLVKLRNPNPSGAIFYTTDGTDPRGEDGSVRSGVEVYSDSFKSHDFGSAWFKRSEGGSRISLRTRRGASPRVLLP